MKFKAHIKLTEEQKEAYMPLQHIDFEFTFKDILEELIDKDEHYPVRHVLIPWLLAGNQPEIMMNENEIKHVCNEIELMGAKKRFKGESG